MIESVHIENFKSLANVTLHMGHFTALIGMNGAGKSTVLQALDFISHLMTGDVEAWLKTRGWKAADLRSKQLNERGISVSVVWRVSEDVKLTWWAVFNTGLMRCTRDWTSLEEQHGQELSMTKLTLLDGSRFYIDGRKWEEVRFTYGGSILASIKDKELPEPVLAMRNALRKIRSLELLSPQLLRKRSRVAEGEDRNIGAGGENLSAFLGTLQGAQRDQLLKLLKTFYPQIVDFKVSNVQAGWKKLTVTEQYGERRQETEATHISDGMLRTLAVLSQVDVDRSLVLLDEIENGINPEIVEPLVDALVQSPQQMLVTTHSPMILNYLDDDTARKSVQFVYKGPDGSTRVRRFFDIERINRKLDVMGPGEAFVDTDLRALTQECIQLDAQQQQQQEKQQQQNKATKDSAA